MSARRRARWNASPLASLGIAVGLQTAAERAVTVGISRSHLLHCEAGYGVPSLDLISRMAVAYGVTEERIERALRDIRNRRGAA